MDYLDIIITIIQSAMFIYTVNYCLGYKNIFDKKYISCVILLVLDSYFIPSILGNNSVCVFATHIVSIIIIIVFFYRKQIEALIAYNLIYSALLISISIFGSILYALFGFIPINEHVEILDKILIYVFQIVFFILCFKKIYLIKQVYKIIVTVNLSKGYVIMISFISDFLSSFYLMTHKNEELLFKHIIIIMLIVFLGVSMVCFMKVNDRAHKIYELNKKLEGKNIELKKIKNIYGMQMSALYELCTMEQYSDLSNLLKNIINKSDNTTIIENNKNEQSMLSYATRHIKSNDMNIVINEKANLSVLTMSEMEIYRVVVNIVNNAVKAMKEKGTLIISAYNKSENVIIEIENDGEMIPKEHIDKIFQSGFTTKKNKDKNHGYGLSIVKELIESYNGKIFVESNESRTKFTIDLPIDKFENSVIM